MRGPKPQTPIVLTENELQTLQRLVRARTSPHGQGVRAQIVLAAHEHPDWSKTICRALERRGVFPPAVRTQATALACSLPQTQGMPLSRWSSAEIAQRLQQTQGVPAISASTIRRWLAAERLHPWRYHAWQHIHDPMLFLERARPVLESYAHAQRLLETGTWLVCLDEKPPSRPAPQNAHPSLPLPGLHSGNRHATGNRERCICSLG